MVAITQWGDKADIRQIVGRDRMSGRKSATVLHSPESPVNPKPRCLKAFSAFKQSGTLFAIRITAQACSYRLRKQQIPPVQEGSQFKCRGQWRIFATRDD